MGSTTNTEPSQRPHFEWQEHVAARTDLIPNYKAVLWRLALHRNGKSGRCDPSYQRLAEGAGVSERTAKRAIAKAERLGLIAVERSGSGLHHDRNHYTFLLEGVSAVTPVGVSAQTPTGDTAVAPHGCQPWHSNNQSNDGTPTASPEREIGGCATAASGAGSLGSPPRRRQRRKEARSAGRPVGPSGGNAAGTGNAAVRADFDELRAAWPRPWLDDEAEQLQAYVKARQHADHATVVAGAKAWAAAVEPRYLKPLAIWLDVRGWEKPPPTKSANGHPRGNGNGPWPHRRKLKDNPFYKAAGMERGPDGVMRPRRPQ